MHRRLRGALFAILGVCLGGAAHAGAETFPVLFRAVPDPTRGLAPLEIQDPSPLPPGWRLKTIGPSGGGPTEGPPASVTVNPATGDVIETYQVASVRIGEPLAATLNEYTEILSARTLRTSWEDKVERSRLAATPTSYTGTHFRAELPIQLPKAVRSIVGDGAPNIEVQGSETISLSGVSSWTSSKVYDTEGRGQSKFPSLEMKQELNVNLTGSIGDKIKIDVDQSSNVVTSIDNTVKLRYEGDEDDMIKAVELGNTNLSVEGASFRQEGLFGIKTVAKLGTVDVVAIASKQQGKTETAQFTPSGEKTRVTIPDLQYMKRTYFLLSDDLLKIDPNTLRVFKDDLIPTNNVGQTSNQTVYQGIARLDPTAVPDTVSNPEFGGNFSLLEPGTDYTLITPWLVDDPNGLGVPVIKLTFGLAQNEVLGITYTDQSTGTSVQIGDPTLIGNPALEVPSNSLLLKMIKPTYSDLRPDSIGLYDTTQPWYPTLFYELRNFYDLGGRDIALESLDLAVRRIEFGAAINPDDVDGTPLIQILGLDQVAVPGAVDEGAPDGEVDFQFIDRAAGIVYFPDVHPFNPDTIPTPNCGPGLSTSLCLDNYGRNTLRLGGTANQANPNVYYKRDPVLATDSRFYIDASYKSAQQGFSLGRFDILENSEQVKIDGIPAQRGIHYTIDYTTGQITFLQTPGPDQRITVDYSFAPGVGSSQLTLMGASASYVPNTDFSLTGSVLYDSRGATEKNPRLGEEPAESFIGNLASVLTFRPVWMTRLANSVPGVRTNVTSTLNIQGGASMSAPNPNTEGVAYVDDMEGDRESYTVGLSRPQWFWSGVPLSTAADTINTSVETHARLQWFNPLGVTESDLKPNLTKQEGGDNSRQVLELKILRPTGQNGVSTGDWTGLTQQISTAGIDFTRFRYIEVWVNDFQSDHAAGRGKLHIDFGHVTEDAFWDPNNIPNNVIDTEDENLDTKLDSGEDTGLDGLDDPEEPGYDPSANPDPHGDDYFYDSDNPKNYSAINNYEGNGNGEPNARPDTEDLNRDNYRDFYNNYFEATLDLEKIERIDPLTGIQIVTDVQQDYPPGLWPNVTPDNGWRLYRIPISDSAFVKVGAAASWQDVQHMRIWMNGMIDTIRVQLGGIEAVGNRWTAQPAPSNVLFTVGSINNKDNAADYEPPPIEIGNTAGTTSESREQSLALTYGGLNYGDSLVAFKTYFDANSGLGWTQYQDINYWVHGGSGVEAQNLRVFARFGADTVNYYEFSAPVRSGWQSVTIPMTVLSQLKQRGGISPQVDSLSGAATGEVYTVVGNPSFTRILRTSFGVTVFGGVGIPDPNLGVDGQVWINELTLSDVKKDTGGRGNVIVQANFADLVSLNMNYAKQNENYMRVGSGATLGSGVNTSALGFSTTLQLDRMMPTSSVQLPLRFSIQKATEIPKYQTGSDIVLTSAKSDQETRKQNRQTVDFTYRRTGTRQGIVRYTLDALNANMAYSKTNNINTSVIDSSVAFTSAVGYDLPIGGGGFGLLGNRMKVNLVPNDVGLTMAWRSSHAVSYARDITDNSDISTLRTNIVERVLNLGADASWVPLSSVRIELRATSARNMLLHQEGMLGLNKGTEVGQTRAFDLNYQPRWLSFFTPSLVMRGSYNQFSGPSIRTGPSDPPGLKNVNNRGNLRLTATIPLTRLGQMTAPRPGAKGGKGTILTPLHVLLSKLQDVQGSFGFDRATSLSRVTGEPDFLFRTGFTSNPSANVEGATNSVSTSNRTYTYGLNTTIRPSASLSLDIRADQQLAYTEANLGSRRTNRVTLPDMKARWQYLEKLLGLQRALASLQLSSSFNVRQDEQGPESGPVEQKLKVTTWAPLLGWEFVWRNGLRTTVTTAVSKNQSIDSRIAGFTGTRQTTDTQIRLTKVYSASKGLKLPFSKKPIRLKNDLNLNLNFTVQSAVQTVARPGFPVATEVNNQQLNVGTNTSYNFTRSISGGFDLGFRQNKDIKTAVTQRGITIALNGQFRF